MKQKAVKAPQTYKMCSEMMKSKHVCLSLWKHESCFSFGTLPLRQKHSKITVFDNWIKLRHEWHKTKWDFRGALQSQYFTILPTIPSCCDTPSQTFGYGLTNLSWLWQNVTCALLGRAVNSHRTVEAKEGWKCAPCCKIHSLFCRPSWPKLKLIHS